MKWNFGTLSRAFAYTMQIGLEFIKAKSEESDGGARVTQSEMLDITAKVSALWAMEDGLEAKVELSEMINAFESAGWKVVYEEEGVKHG